MSKILFRGTLTEEKFKELQNDYFIGENAISLRKQEDGNWKGTTTRHGKLLEVREQAPEYCLQKLLTHE